jgi:hypothetical protein
LRDEMEKLRDTEIGIGLEAVLPPADQVGAGLPPLSPLPLIPAKAGIQERSGALNELEASSRNKT